MSKETKPVEPEPAVASEPEPEPKPDAVTQALARVSDATASVITLTEQADSLLGEFNTAAQEQPVDTGKLLELARKRDDILGTEARPGSLARANGALAKARAALTEATWELTKTERIDATRAIHSAFEPARDTLAASLPPLPVPTIIVAPLATDAFDVARADAGAALHVAQLRVAALDAVAAQRESADKLLALGCDRLRVAWEALGESAIPVSGFVAVKTGSVDLSGVRKPSTRKPSGNGGTRSRAVYTDGGASYSAREYALAFEPERAAAIDAKIATGASLSHTHLADSIMKARIAAGHTVSKTV